MCSLLYCYEISFLIVCDIQMDIVLYPGTGYARQEWKATLTVAIVVLTFLICWLPFFVLALVRPLAQHIIIPGKCSLKTVLSTLMAQYLSKDLNETLLQIGSRH